MRNNNRIYPQGNMSIIANKQITRKEAENMKNIGKLSIEKIKKIMTLNSIKKSKSLTGFAPEFFNCYELKRSTQHQNASIQPNNSTNIQTLKISHKSPKKVRTRITFEKDIKSIKQKNLQNSHKIINKYYEQDRLKVNNEQTDFMCLKVPKFSKIASNYSETLSTSCSRNQKGLHITDFELGKIAGFGKFGQVYLARHLKTGFLCALKQIKKDGLDEMLESQLVREIKIQSFMNHPNIIKLYTFFSDRSNIYLVLEPCCSGQLYNFLSANRPVAEDIGKVIIKQVCQGIDYLHENHIIHRDLKPQNILFHNSMMKICDFGWSVATPLMRQTFCGTPLYVSPELLKRDSYSNKVDIWSLGVLTYEILIGQVPFEIFSEADYIKIIKNEVRFPKSHPLSVQAVDFICWCLEKNPHNRPTSAELLSHQFLNKVELNSYPQIN